MNRIAIRPYVRLDPGSAWEADPDARDEELEAAVLELVREAPRTVQQVSDALRVSATEGRRHLNHLCQERRIERWRAGGQVVFRAVSSLPRLHRPSAPSTD